MTRPDADIVAFYLEAHGEVVGAGYESELAWLDRVVHASVSEQQFLEEAAWVILSAGFRYSVIASRFPAIRTAFSGFASAELLVTERERHERDALKIFGNRRKISAISQAGHIVYDSRFANIIRAARHDFRSLTVFPQIGPAAAAHLARNIGLPVAKPDRHLMRLATQAKMEVEEMASRLARITGDPVGLVDGVLWRHAVLPATACFH